MPENQANSLKPPTKDDAFLKSSFFEQLVEHVFISELLQEVYYRFGMVVEVLRSEIDASGYDIVLECNGIIRHVQLKTSRALGKTSRQKVNIALSEKPSGCIVWIVRDEDNPDCRIKLSYRFFGDDAGKPLPSLDGFSIAKHTKGNKDGVKAERPAIRIVNKGQFTHIETTTELAIRLFDIEAGSDEVKAV